MSGIIRVWGSPQMGPLLDRYEQAFQHEQPSVRFENDLKSTITAVAGVYTDRADLGLLGRELWPLEQQAFESIKGHAPTVVPVATGAFDVPKATFALMIFVSKSNPVPSLSLPDLERIFSNTTRHPVRTWGDLGVTGPRANHPVHLYGFPAENDKSRIFSDLVFRNGERWNCALHEFSNDLAPSPLDAGEKIARAVAADPDGIGISNIHYAQPGIKALPLAPHTGDAPIEPTRQTVAAHTYPLTRFVYVVLDRSTAHPLTPALEEFLRFVLSRQGADAVVAEGEYLPLTSAAATQASSALGLH